MVHLVTIHGTITTRVPPGDGPYNKIGKGDQPLFLLS